MRTFATMKTLAVALAIATSVTACAAVSGRETVGEYIDDATVTTRVKTALLGEPSLKSVPISVETMQNVVQLSGFVDSQQTKLKAAEVALRVDGVRSVNNSLIVK